MKILIEGRMAQQLPPGAHHYVDRFVNNNPRALQTLSLSILPPDPQELSELRKIPRIPPLKQAELLQIESAQDPITSPFTIMAFKALLQLHRRIVPLQRKHDSMPLKRSRIT